MGQQPQKNPFDLIEGLAHAPCLTARELEEITAASCVLTDIGILPPATEARLRWLWEEKGRIGS